MTNCKARQPLAQTPLVPEVADIRALLRLAAASLGLLRTEDLCAVGNEDGSFPKIHGGADAGLHGAPEAGSAASSVAKLALSEVLELCQLVEHPVNLEPAASTSQLFKHLPTHKSNIIHF